MLFSVPQYIDVEDKIVGPLTVKQLLWMIAAGVLTLVLWTVLPKSVFFLIAIPEIIFFAAMAFYKPYGQPLIGFLIAGVLFIFSPKIYVRKRSAQPRSNRKVSEEKAMMDKVSVDQKIILGQQERRKIAFQNLSGIAKILDSDGEQSDQKVIDILQKIPEKRK